MRFRHTVSSVFPAFVALTFHAVCQEAPAKVRVAISPFAPFVMKSDSGKPTGYSIDLWRDVASHADLAFELIPATGVKEKLDMLAAAAVDVAIGGITITEKREERVDFTHASFNSGLDILIPVQARQATFLDRIRPMLTRGKLVILLGFLFLIVASGHLMWFAERGKDMFNDRYFPGVFEGMYWAIVTASTVGYGDKAPVKWTGRALAAIVIIISLPMFAYFTAEMASAFTMYQLRSTIQGPGDLVGRRVAVLAGTTSDEFVSGIGADVRCKSEIIDCYAALEAGYVDAVVYDSPNLRYYAEHEGAGKVSVVGNVFAKQALGMAVPEGSPLRERINRALLALGESGRIAELRGEWFGDDSD